MSKKRNKRNTRRGRAKRWTVVRDWPDFVYRLRRTLIIAGPFTYGSEWCAFDYDAATGEPGSRSIWMPNRASAMRAAEHPARQRWR